MLIDVIVPDEPEFDAPVIVKVIDAVEGERFKPDDLLFEIQSEKKSR